MKKNLTTLFMMFVALTAAAQFKSAPAFPGAEGFGRYVTGGRGGTIYHVTNLNDSGAGSLREGVKKSGKRIIVFDVAGTIELKSALKIQNDNITILGQTAPGDGICLKNYTFGIFANNVIIRFIRCRMGNEIKAADGSTAVEDDAMNAYQKDGSNKTGIIIDHCSMSWSVDECGSFYGNKEFTLQWCILAESLVNGGHTKGAHGYGGIWGGESAAFHHNLLAHHDSRNPRFDHGYVSTLAGPVDYINNVVYNWGGNSTYGGENKPGCAAKKFNMVNNYYKPGPFTVAQNKTTKRLLNPTTKCSNCNSSDQYNIVPGKFFINGNIVNGTAATVSTTNIAFDSGYSLDKFKTNCVLSARAKSSAQDFSSYSTISMQSAEGAFNKVVSFAGASLSRDRVDADVCEDTKTGTAKYKGSISKRAGLIDDPQDVGGWPVLKGTKAEDTDNDGIPDAWEKENGLNPNDASDASTFSLDPKGYYTNIEVYANSLVEGIVKAQRADAEETFEEYYPTIKSEITTPEEGGNEGGGNEGGDEGGDLVAQTYFSMVPSVASTSDLSNGQTLQGSEFATVTGGKVMYQNNNTTAYKAVQSSKFYIGTSSCYFKIDLDTPMKTGDVMTFYDMPATSNGLNGVFVGTSSTDKTYSTTTDVFGTVTYSVPDAFDGVKTIYLNRVQGKGTYFAKLTIDHMVNPSSISTVTSEKGGAMFNLSGQRVGDNYKGIVIKNGKKYIIK